MKILLINSDSNNVINFRKELINYLKNKGENVFLVVGDTKRKADIDKLEVETEYISLTNRNKNPFSLLKARNRVKKYIKRIKPDIVFTFQIKANVVGVHAAKKAGVKKIYSMVEGLGDPFRPSSRFDKFLLKIICHLYKKVFAYSTKVFLLNNDDKHELLTRNLIKKDKVIVIPGIGINTEQYKFSSKLPEGKRVSNFARLIVTKGIIEYCEIARLVHETRPDITFELYGAESELTINDLKPYFDDGSIVYGGFIKDVSDKILSSRLVVSTSFYREGFPRIILESMALGRVVIGTNTVGTKDEIVDGANGFIIKKHDIKGFANKIISIIDNDELLTSVAKNARSICEKQYDSNIVNSIIYNEILK